jgi:hypothetical protein
MPTNFISDKQVFIDMAWVLAKKISSGGAKEASGYGGAVLEIINKIKDRYSKCIFLTFSKGMHYKKVAQ